jgi:hydroxymethylglutaryl-CoA lyase
MVTLPSRVKIVEVGPRDGLQNESQLIEPVDKVALINGLAQANISHIEAGSFVNPKWVPQMASSAAVFAGILRSPATIYSALVPNLQGYQRAIQAGANEVAIFGAASESFTQKNINCSIEESLRRFLDVMKAAKADNVPVRGYVSCVVACPYEGTIDAAVVRDVSEQLLNMGCYEVSLGDTIGVATPADVNSLLTVLTSTIAVEKLAVHFHDTYGQALANIYAALHWGIATIDSSVAGLGGCPYAKGASGNVATEDVVYLLNGLSIETGIDLEKLIPVGNLITSILGKPNQSKVASAKTNA